MYIDTEIVPLQSSVNEYRWYYEGANSHLISLDDWPREGAPCENSLAQKAVWVDHRVNDSEVGDRSNDRALCGGSGEYTKSGEEERERAESHPRMGVCDDTELEPGDDSSFAQPLISTDLGCRRAEPNLLCP